MTFLLFNYGFFYATEGSRRWAMVGTSALVPLCFIGTMILGMSPYILPIYMSVDANMAERVRNEENIFCILRLIYNCKLEIFVVVLG